MITEVVCLRSKMYSYKTDDDHEGKRIKGIKRNITEN